MNAPRATAPMDPGGIQVDPTGIHRSTIDRYRIDPPDEVPLLAPSCSRHPGVESVYVAIPVQGFVDGAAAIVRGWACRGCWTLRGFRLEATT